MSIYNDMANDAGYSYGTEENEQMASWIEADRMYQMQEAVEEELYWEAYWESINKTCFGIEGG